MKPIAHLMVALSLPLLATSPAAAQSAPAQPSGINLEGFEYPYPTQVYRFASQQQTLEMTYMDIAPADPLKANGRTVLLLHGKNFGGDYWGRTAGDLAAAGFRVVVPDQVGFGKSSKPANYQFTFQQLATNTFGLLDSIGVKEFEVVGHSMGGMLATRMTLMAPARVTRLVLVNPIGLEDWKTVVPYQPIDSVYQSELKKDAAAIRAYMQKVYYDGKWKPEYDRPVELLASMSASPGYPRAAWNSALTYDMIMTQPVLYEFPMIRTPTLLIIGTRDRTAIGKETLPPEIGATMGRYDQLGRKTAAAIPGAKLVELDDIGHMPMLEAYDRYFPPLEEFLQD